MARAIEAKGKAFSPEWLSEKYTDAIAVWPSSGKHVLAQYYLEAEEPCICVYQAFNPEIARYAVQHQRFRGCAHYQESRMTWIKTNFLWMQFRSGWCAKKNQQRCLAIWLHVSAFERYLEKARKKGSADGQGVVRLQWDPDHYPNGSKHLLRKAIQLGLKGMPGFASGRDIVCIQDVTEFVERQGALANMGATDQLLVARERLYPVQSAAAREAIGLSSDDDEHD